MSKVDFYNDFKEVTLGKLRFRIFEDGTENYKIT